MNNVNVYMIDMPSGTNEAVTENEDGSYSIFINDHLSPAGRLESYHHAMRHIEHNDFEKSDVQEIEANAHEIVKPEKREQKPQKKERLKKTSKKQWEQMNQRVAILSSIDPNYALNEYEHEKLYGEI